MNNYKHIIETIDYDYWEPLNNNKSVYDIVKEHKESGRNYRPH